MFSIVNLSPRRCKAFPPTATTNRCFFFGFDVVVVLLDAAIVGAADADVGPEKNRTDKLLIRNTVCRCVNMMNE
jgi:hypothetical protein